MTSGGLGDVAHVLDQSFHARLSFLSYFFSHHDFLGSCDSSKSVVKASVQVTARFLATPWKGLWQRSPDRCSCEIAE